MNERIRIKIKAYDHAVLDRCAGDIVAAAKKTGAKIMGPIPLPTRVERYTVLRSPHADKKARDQFEVRTHKRILDIWEATPKTIDELQKLRLPAGIDISIRMGVTK
ncbi:MAG: 30S ribosomal protein S10 [Planctomycetota bacterium]